MRLIKPSYEIIEQGPGLQGIYDMIEKCGKISYKSEAKGGETAKRFVDARAKEGHGAVWYHPDETGENRKINADGKGWYAYCNKGLLLLKTFDDLKSQNSQLTPAPSEAEIQVYVNRGKTFIELEAQGAYTTLKPHEALSWTVRWYLLPVADSAEPSAELMKNVKMKK